MGVSKNRGTPKSSILIGFSIISHPFWGFSPYFWKHPPNTGKSPVTKIPTTVSWVSRCCHAWNCSGESMQGLNLKGPKTKVMGGVKSTAKNPGNIPWIPTEAGVGAQDLVMLRKILEVHPSCLLTVKRNTLLWSHCHLEMQRWNEYDLANHQPQPLARISEAGKS